MTYPPELEASRALWNRKRLHLRSDEVLAQILDRGEVAAWRALYVLAGDDPTMRRRMLETLYRVPIGYAHFWLAALAGLGEPVDWERALPSDAGWA